MGKPFRFGVQVRNAVDGKAWRDLARKIESLGYSTLYVPDHFTDQWGPIVALTVAAEATSTLVVGALVFDNDYRHPITLAKEMLTLDLVSEGRVEFGLGAGWMKSDYDAAGIAYDEPKVRVDRFEEALGIYTALFRQGVATAKTTHYDVAALQGEPRPAVGPKILIGGGGKRVLGIAARHADIVGVNPSLKAGYVGPEVAASALAPKFHERIGWLREAAGTRFDDIELQILTFFVQITDDRAGALDNLAPLFGVASAAAAEVPLALVGSVDEIVETLHRRREEYGFSNVVIHEGEVEDFAPVVEALAGT
ncbi:MAG TPA: TIGR03621 family F420-dependent LLM class oxidoreductase [Acidimicrobiales bacterium]|nr:TIGR03621 family F420-dependent LLM class oxidoreductase [Acidimicrobiales bacterium]